MSTPVIYIYFQKFMHAVIYTKAFVQQLLGTPLLVCVLSWDTYIYTYIYMCMYKIFIQELKWDMKQ